MNNYFDSSVLVGAILSRHPLYEKCRATFNCTPHKISCAHALAEIFVTLNGIYKVPNTVAVEQILTLHDNVKIMPLIVEDYQIALKETRQRGVMGAGIYDSLHAVFARRYNAKRIFTLNVSDFEHVAPDFEIVTF